MKTRTLQTTLIALLATLALASASAATVSPNGCLEDSCAPAPKESETPALNAREAITLTFELRNPEVPDLSFLLTTQISAFPRVQSGTISGAICDSPNWSITNGFITGKFIVLVAVHTGGGTCANNVLIVAKRSGSYWTGKYIWNYNSQNPQVYNCYINFVQYVP